MPGLKWVFRMAFRDMRRAKGKLFLFALAIVAGVAALVAVNSFKHNLEVEMERQALALLGADVEYDAHQPFSDESLSLIESVPHEGIARKTRFSTMAFFPKQESSRLVMANAVEGGFPWYGTMDTRPSGLSVSESEEPVALVEDSLMLQFGLAVGDPIRIGNAEFKIIGELLRIPGEGSFTGSFAPRVLIPMRFLSDTGVVQYGSRLHYFVYQKFDDENVFLAASRLDAIRDQFRDREIDVDTIEDQKRQLGRTLDRMGSFLSMIGFVSLLLGGVAIGSAVQVYLQEKKEAYAILRCLGCSGSAALLVYSVQISLVGLVGCLLGGLLGIGVQFWIPSVLSSFIPFDVQIEIAWASLFSSVGFGWVFTSAFAFLPLLPFRHVSPLRAIRASYESSRKSWRDGALWGVALLLLGLSLAFSVMQTRSLGQALAFLGGIIGAIMGLYLTGSVVRLVLRKLRLRRLPFVWRQGLANLYRPNNRTGLLVVTIGTGAFLIFVIYICEQSILRQGDMKQLDGEPNVILFDIQPDQVEGIGAIVRQNDLRGLPSEPIVTMRIQSLNGQSVEQLREVEEPRRERWAFTREYRSTYRNYLHEDEELVSGDFIGKYTFGSEDPVPVSVEERVVEALHLKLGDLIVWDVQGIPIETRVSSIRKVDWRQMKPNFFVVFPSGVLEAAPAFFISAVNAPTREAVASLQSEVVQMYPNVSIINLTMVLDTLEAIFDKVSFVIRFMASFTIVTGLIALAASVYTSRYQRSRETSVLRTLGASQRQVRMIIGVEFLLVGVVAAVSGVFLSFVGAWGVTRFVLEIPMHFPWWESLLTIVFVSGITWITGSLNSLGIARRSPLESIRAETV